MSPLTELIMRNQAEVLSKAIKLVIILALAFVATRISNYVVSKLSGSGRKLVKSDPRHVATLNSLLKSVIKYAIAFIAVITILDIFNVPTSSVLAGAGILGIALGFGAQNFVKDVIMGFFIIYEDQYSVGDYVSLAGLSGVVEEIGLRVTKLRDFNGDIHMIPNGLVEKTTNHSRGNIRVAVDIGITYREDMERAISVLESVCADLRKRNPDITHGPEVLGVSKLAESSVMLRIAAKTLPMHQWEVERKILKSVKEAFDAEHVEFAYPHIVVVENKSAPDITDQSPQCQ